MITPITDIGEAVVSINEEGGRDYLLRPSFAAMLALGTPEEIVELYATVHNVAPLDYEKLAQSLPDAMKRAALLRGEKERDRLLTAAMRVIEACYGGDLPELVGEWYGDENGVRYLPGVFDAYDLVVMAQHFMTHGVIGKAQIRKLQRHETNETTTGFKALEYINAARIHLDMTREEAERLTMTEFQYLLDAKYPDQKGLTREEYDKVADDYLAKQAARRAAAAAQ